jgi:hypothetical protein
MRDFEALGWEWAAWYAMIGDEDRDKVHASAAALQRSVGDLSARLHEQGDRDGSDVAAAASLFMVALAEMLDPNGTSLFKAEIGKRGKGRPHNRLAIARRGHHAAAIVDKLVAEGVKQEAAVQQSSDETGLSRAEIMAWLSHDRATIRRSAK